MRTNVTYNLSLPALAASLKKPEQDLTQNDRIDFLRFAVRVFSTGFPQADVGLISSQGPLFGVGLVVEAGNPDELPAKYPSDLGILERQTA